MEETLPRYGSAGQRQLEDTVIRSRQLEASVIEQYPHGVSVSGTPLNPSTTPNSLYAAEKRMEIAYSACNSGATIQQHNSILQQDTGWEGTPLLPPR